MPLYRLLLPFLLLFSAVAYAQTDTAIGVSAPDEVSDDITKLAHYLCGSLDGDRLKANAIYNWVTHNIEYDPYGMYAFGTQNGTRKERAAKVLEERKGVCEGYSKLFTELCVAAGLKAVCICGYSKDWTFDNGDKLYIPRHMWAAVRVDGWWELVDVTWGAGYLSQSRGWLKRRLGKGSGMPSASSRKQKFTFRYDTTYFLQDPMTFRLKHLPIDPLWQLTDTIMPREFFEAGDSAVKSFNALCKRTDKTDVLTRISEMNERDMMVECAERAYKYNDRYPDIMAVKQVYSAVEDLQKVAGDSTMQTIALRVQSALDGLRLSLALIEKQKRGIPEQYTELRRKNMNKTLSAKQDINNLKGDNLKMMAECRKYVNAAESRVNQAKKKRDGVKKHGREVRASDITGVAQAKVQKKADAPEMKAMKDSLKARWERLTVLKEDIRQLELKRMQWSDRNRARMDTLPYYLAMADTMVLRQAIERMNMKDNYDDEIVVQKRSFKKMKQEKLDTMMKNYFVAFDTITALYEHKHKISLQLLDLYKKSLRTMEQYRKWNSSDETILAQYTECRSAYANALIAYNESINEAASYSRIHKRLFAFIGKLGKSQIKASEYMDKAEKTRKVLEEKELNQKQALDRKESEERKKVIEKSIRELEQAKRASGL